MFCNKCGHIINDKMAEFCVGCGFRFSHATAQNTQQLPHYGVAKQRTNMQMQDVLKIISAFLDKHWVTVAGSLAVGSALLYFVFYTVLFATWQAATLFIAALVLVILIFAVAKKQIDLTVIPLALAILIRIISLLIHGSTFAFIYFFIYVAMLAIFLLTLCDVGGLSKQVRVIAGFSLPGLYFFIALFNIHVLFSVFSMFAAITFLGSISILNYIAVYSRDYNSLTGIDINNLPNAPVNISPQSGYILPPPTVSVATQTGDMQQRIQQRDDGSVPPQN